MESAIKIAVKVLLDFHWESWASSSAFPVYQDMVVVCRQSLETKEVLEVLSDYNYDTLTRRGHRTTLGQRHKVTGQVNRFAPASNWLLIMM